MTLDMTDTVHRIYVVMKDIAEFEAVYGASETGIDGLPPRLGDYPAAVVYPGADINYNLQDGQQSHHYEVLINVFQGGAELSERAATVLPFVDLVIAKFATNVRLGGNVTLCKYLRQSGFATMEYGDADHIGYQIVLEVIEHANVEVRGG